MKRLTLPLVILVIFGGIMLIRTVAFTVDQREQALVLLFGDAKRVEHAWGADDKPGLKFKLPWENVVKFDRRNLMLDAPAKQILASDQEWLMVDVFARYRIADPLLFYQRVTTVRGAELRMTPFLEASVKSVLGSHDSTEIVSGHRVQMMQDIRDQLEAQTKGANLGVEIIDVKIRHADLPKENTNKVFIRMISERHQEAAKIRAEGEEAALKLRAEADREVRVILANAKEQSSRVRGTGDAERNEIYAKAYNQDPEFFAFYRSMEAYERALANGNTSMVLSPDSEFFRYFGSQNGK
jgi:membrane protease subunit HflC